MLDLLDTDVGGISLHEWHGAFGVCLVGEESDEVLHKRLYIFPPLHLFWPLSKRAFVMMPFFFKQTLIDDVIEILIGIIQLPPYSFVQPKLSHIMSWDVSLFVAPS